MQRANLDRARGREETLRRRDAAAANYAERAAEINGHARVLREVLAKLPG